MDLLFREFLTWPEEFKGQYKRHVFERAYRNNPEYELCRVTTMLEF